MKKSIIAASAASLAVAAMPVVGVFAATQSNFTDTLNLTVEGGCTFKSSVLGDYSRAFAATVAAGQEADFTMNTGEPTMSVVCNTETGNYTVQAIGGTSVEAGATGVTVLSNGTAADNIATGTTFSGDTSAWAFKVTSTGSTATGWTAVPSSLTTVVTNSASSAKSTDGVTFTPAYHVYASGSQSAGSYTGNVSYLLVNPA